MNKIQNNLGNLIGLGLDMELFFSVSISDYDLSLLGKYSKSKENYLLKKGFIKCNVIYNDNPEWVEFKKDNCRIALTK